MHTFSISEALAFGWHKTRDHSGLLFQIMLTLFALQVVSTMVSKVLEHSWLGILASLALGVVGVVLSAGFTVVALKIAEGHAAHYRDIIPPGELVWRFFAASFVAGVGIVAGLILLVIPGIFLLVRLSMARFAVVDGAAVIASLRRSWRQTRGHGWHLFGFFLALAGINIIGALLLFVGLLVSVPVSMLAWAHVYHKLKNRA